MTLLLPDGLPNTDRVGNPILPSFRNMIRLEALMLDPEYSDNERPIRALQLLYGNNLPKNTDDPIGELLWFYHCGKPLEGKGGGAGGAMPRLYDFELDAPYMYAGFLQAYNIDLSIKTGLKLHWWEFSALFMSLPENTAMGQRMFFRGVDTSQMKGEQKTYYETRKKSVALPSLRTPAKSLAEMEDSYKQRVAKRFADAEQRYQQQNGGD